RKIDLCAALAFACLEAVKSGMRGEPGIIGWARDEALRLNGPDPAGGQPPPSAAEPESVGGDLDSYYEERRAYCDSLQSETGGCHYCGQQIKGITTTGTDGNSYHPACWREKLRG